MFLKFKKSNQRNSNVKIRANIGFFRTQLVHCIKANMTLESNLIRRLPVTYSSNCGNFKGISWDFFEKGQKKIQNKKRKFWVLSQLKQSNATVFQWFHTLKAAYFKTYFSYTYISPETYINWFTFIQKFCSTANKNEKHNKFQGGAG